MKNRRQTLIDFIKWVYKYRYIDIEEKSVDLYLKSINEHHGEAKNVSENEGKRNICPQCKGRRKVNNRGGGTHTCLVCEGEGVI